MLALQVTLVNRSTERMPRAFLRDWAVAMSRRLKRLRKHRLMLSGELVIVFLDMREARALNRKFRGKDYATDILSFASDEPGAMGELVICPQVIRRQAREHGLLLREELGYMVLHGALHLLGYDHEGSKSKADEMFALQDRLFEILLKDIHAIG